METALEALCKAAYAYWLETVEERNHLDLGLSHRYTEQEKHALLIANRLADDAWRAWRDMNRIAYKLLGIPSLF